MSEAFRRSVDITSILFETAIAFCVVTINGIFKTIKNNATTTLTRCFMSVACFEGFAGCGFFCVHVCPYDYFIQPISSQRISLDVYTCTVLCVSAVRM